MQLHEKWKANQKNLSDGLKCMRLCAFLISVNFLAFTYPDRVRV